MKIGVTSQNFRTITGHAGKARRFIVYEMDDQRQVAEVDRLDLPKTMSIHETIPTSPHPLDELAVLITQSGGEGYIRKMASRGVQVILTSASDPEAAVRSLLKGEQLPPPELGDHEGHGHGDGGCGCSCGS